VIAVPQKMMSEVPSAYLTVTCFWYRYSGLERSIVRDSPSVVSSEVA
jgi:hypothetical protein